MTIPTSTYRLQISPDFTLDEAADHCARIAALGADAVYLSPLLTSTTGSDHGYDWTDWRQVDPQRGGEEGWRRFVQAAREAGLKIVVDIVPNHMGISKPWENEAWWSVLREGRHSPYAHWFDIDWERPALMLPFLPADGSLDGLELNDDRTELRFYDDRLPIAPGTADDGAPVAVVAQRQVYRLVPWTGGSRLTHRRFFAVETLAGLRVEDEDVFAATHERVLRWVHEDGIEGLRVDHPDGLVDPRGYFTRLREAVGPDVWLLGEKILETDEPLPHWPIDGTTGYDAMAEVNLLLGDPSADAWMTAEYVESTGDERSVAEHVLEGKRFVAQTMFSAEVNRILRELPVVPADVEDAADTLRELAARVPVYRSYLPDNAGTLARAIARLRDERPDLALTVDELEPTLIDANQPAAKRFEQLSGAVMAKGVEDTAWYRYTRQVGLNEVGGHPGELGCTLAQAHHALERRQRLLPGSMTALSTHDTKRGEDVRARLAVLTELPEAWPAFREVFDAHTRISNPRFSRFVAQTLVGVGLGLDNAGVRERIKEYLVKAMREASEETTWTDSDEVFERSVLDAVDIAHDHPVLHEAWQTLLGLVEGPARSNSLTQKLVQLTMPGVPDVYRGTEVWEDSLVDPDNRRPVAWDAMPWPGTAVEDGAPAVDETGAAKQWLVHQALTARRNRPQAFTAYTPLLAAGSASDHLFGFDRGGAVTLATRLPVGLAARGGWGDTSVLLPRPCVDVLTGREFSGRVYVAQVLDELPVALLLDV
ncbi:malto-oligosyltrehalose synthase [Aestuariimicrobium ganziense]|uniref:malto-oligosyltrehalose synthase n=1 Tax=Aestuariimicrobium ganziense TaxID=2773677 RepID=UPI0019420AF6|nr:malto-oligosyltrehalose synthase [Aestuariimicrobium ganziense]